MGKKNLSLHIRPIRSTFLSHLHIICKDWKHVFTCISFYAMQIGPDAMEKQACP